MLVHTLWTALEQFPLIKARAKAIELEAEARAKAIELEAEGKLRRESAEAFRIETEALADARLKESQADCNRADAELKRAEAERVRWDMELKQTLAGSMIDGRNGIRGAIEYVDGSSTVEAHFDVEKPKVRPRDTKRRGPTRRGDDHSPAWAGVAAEALEGSRAAEVPLGIETNAAGDDLAVDAQVLGAT
jgi:hypothetical protein